jgi:hypothetical protein
MTLGVFRGDAGYDLLLLIHIISFLVAAAPAVINPIMGPQLGADSPQAGGRFMELTHRNSQRVHLPGLLVLGLSGIILVLVSDDAWSFGDAWVSLGLLVWLAIGGMVSAVMMPGEKKVAGGDPSGLRQVQLGGQITSVLLLVQLYLMVFKPGA